MSMELTEKCKEIRKQLIEVVSKNGGTMIGFLFSFSMKN